MRTIKILFFVCFLFSFNSSILTAQERTINCINNGNYSIYIGQEIDCHFSFSDGINNVVIWTNVGEIRVFDGSWKTAGVNTKSTKLKLSNYTSRDVKIRIDEVGDYTITFRYKLNGKKVRDFKVNFNVYDKVEIGNIDIKDKGTGKAKVTVNTNKKGSGEENLQYSIDSRMSQSSNIFNDVTSGNHDVAIVDNLTSFTATRSFAVAAAPPPSSDTPILTAVVTDSDCSGNSGSIDLSIENFDTYIEFNGSTDVTIGGFDFVDKRDFTIEGRIRVNEDNASFSSRKFISLFGEDNTVEFGFINGKLSFYVATDGWVHTFYGTSVYPNDGEWHHVAIRGDGSKIQLLVDGLVVNTYTKSYNSLRVDSGGAKDILVGNGVWGQSNEAFKGDISRLAFWEKSLSDTEIASLQGATWLTGEEDGLISAYNINRRDGNTLIAVGPESQDGTLSNPTIQWKSWVESYSWTGPDGYSKGDVQDILHLKPGDYTVTVRYESGELHTSSESFTVNQINDLQVKMLDPSAVSCEGQQLNIVTEIKGGIIDKKYTWIVFEGSDEVDVIGTNDSFDVPYNLLGDKSIKLKVQSGVCDKVSNDIPITIHKKIKTRVIKHVKN